MTIAVPELNLIDQEHIVLTDVSWELYEHLLKEIGNRPIRITFDNGSLEMMAPLDTHEYWKKRIGFLIEQMCMERGVDFQPGGSVTLKLKPKRKGLEPDECYFIQSAALLRERRKIDLRRGPRPDLAIEVDITSRSIEREPIYAAFGIPELWRFDGKSLTVLKLDASGHYRSADSSDAFPFLPMRRFERFLKRFETETHLAVGRAFRDWVKSL